MHGRVISFIPVARIAGRCAVAETNVTFDYGEDSVNVCIPLLPRAAYARAGLSNRFCPSVVVVVIVVCHTKILKNPFYQRFRGYNNF